jgi:hypothetical protein
MICACGGDQTGEPPGSPGGSSDPWSSNDGGAANPDPTNPPNEKTCGGQSIPIELKPGAVPDLFLVVDKSGSMAFPVSFDPFNPKGGPGTGMGDTKWVAMRKALVAVLDQFKQRIRFGLSLFPGPGDCTPGAIDVPLKSGAEPTIKARLNATQPQGGTPTHTTLSKVRSHIKTVPPGPGGGYVLLATDGQPNCGGINNSSSSGPQTVDAVKGLAADGVKTFVLGFGQAMGNNPQLLDQLAVAGGTAKPSGPHKFYLATNAKELEQAMLAIAGGIAPVSCTYKLNSPPPDPKKVTVKLDGVAAPRDPSHASGWDYSAGGTEITFFGADCDRVSKGQVKKIEVIYGCKGPVIE